jgi:pterin-4a-carbinolamine dehydratase
MNRIASLAQVKLYKSRPLSVQTHTALGSTLRHFVPNTALTHLSYTHRFPVQSLPFLHEKMTRIGTVADEIDHHPEWTLREGELEIRLSTHDIGNKVSLKDYFLANWIEEVLHGGEIEQVVLRGWNERGIQLEELQ